MNKYNTNLKLFIIKILTMKKLIRLVIIAIVGFASTANAQLIQTPFSMYTLEPTMVNPGTTGLDNEIKAFFNYRKQWSGISDAPKISSGLVQGKVFQNTGIGISFKTATSGVFKYSNTSLKYSHTIKINDNQYLSPGISIDINQNRLSKDGLTTSEIADPALIYSSFNKNYLAGAFGFRYGYRNLIVDFVMPNMYSYENKAFAENVLTFFAYDFKTTDLLWRVQPSFLYSKNVLAKFSEYNLMVEYRKTLWVQGSFRSNSDKYIIFGVNYKLIGFAYMYEITRSSVSSVTKNSHEIVLRFSFPYRIIK